jgi:hypothetical protein
VPLHRERHAHRVGFLVSTHVFAQKGRETRRSESIKEGISAVQT